MLSIVWLLSDEYIAVVWFAYNNCTKYLHLLSVFNTYACMYDLRISKVCSSATSAEIWVEKLAL